MRNRASMFAGCSHRNGARSGVSLIEVIVSMLIMSIGVVLLMTLLPISILRTAQASQLTQAVFLRNNAEALLNSNPNILNVIGTLATNTISVTINGTTYTTTATNTVGNNTYAVVDPLGVFVENTTQPLQFWPQTGAALLPRYYGGVNNRAQAANMAQLPDSWSTFVAEGPVSYTSGSPPIITMPTAPSTLKVYNAFSQNPANNLDNAHYRLVLFDITGKNVVVKPLLQASGSSLSWWDVDPSSGSSLTFGSSLPANFTPVRGRIDVLDRRFTWFMTVTKQPTGTATWNANVSVAVFFNRAFSLNDETPYSLTFTTGGTGLDGANGVRNVDDDNNGTVDDASELGWRESDDNRTVTVSWTSGSSLKPTLKKGGYLLEPNYLMWYRILDLQSTSATTATLLLDQDLQYDSGITPPVAGVITLAGIFMKGIVDVYPLAKISGP